MVRTSEYLRREPHEKDQQQRRDSKITLLLSRHFWQSVLESRAATAAVRCEPTLGGDSILVDIYCLIFLVLI
jgi:hypothetical protein